LIEAKDGKWLTVEAVQPTQEKAIGYNLEVENDHTYFVGESNAWVHNNSCPIPNSKVRDAIAKLRNGEEIHVKTVEEAREILRNMPDLNSGGGQLKGMYDPPGTYRGDLMYAVDADGTPKNYVHPYGPGLGADHGAYPHYNIRFHDGTKSTITIGGG
jgi:hypothetical protein